MGETSFSEIEELDDPVIMAAFKVPKAPTRAKKVFDFLRENQHLTTALSGMTPFITGIDRSKLLPVARDLYGIDLSKWRFAVSHFEAGILKRQEAAMV